MSTPDLPPIRIATRASHLALWQAHHVTGLLRSVAPGRNVEIVHVSTVGDRDQTEPIRRIGELGVFTREVQRAVLDGRADIAVHSLKDLPTEQAEGLCLAAVPVRGDVSDALVFPESQPGATGLEALPQGSRVGTGSLRRQAQLLHVRPDLRLSEARGNVETRLRKLDAGEFDALVLAAAGLMRLNLEYRIRVRLTPPLMFPAVGQGALGIECRAEDAAILALLAQLEDSTTRAGVTAERSLLANLRAGCSAPVGVATRTELDALVLEAVVLSRDGRERLFASSRSAPADASDLGTRVANDLRGQGANVLIDAARRV